MVLSSVQKEAHAYSLIKWHTFNLAPNLIGDNYLI